MKPKCIVKRAAIAPGFEITLHFPNYYTLLHGNIATREGIEDISEDVVRDWIKRFIDKELVDIEIEKVYK